MSQRRGKLYDVTLNSTTEIGKKWKTFLRIIPPLFLFPSLFEPKVNELKAEHDTDSLLTCEPFDEIKRRNRVLKLQRTENKKVSSSDPFTNYPAAAGVISFANALSLSLRTSFGGRFATCFCTRCFSSIFQIISSFIRMYAGGKRSTQTQLTRWISIFAPKRF